MALTPVAPPEIPVQLEVALPDVVAMQTRQPHLEGTGEIALRRVVEEVLLVCPTG